MDYNRYVKVRDKGTLRWGRPQRYRKFDPKLSTGEDRFDRPDRRRSNSGAAKGDPKAPPWSIHHVKTIKEVLDEIAAENIFYRRR